MKKRGETHLLARAFGAQAMAGAAGILLGGVLGALLGSLWLRLAWLAAGLGVSVAVLVAWKYMDEAGECEDRVTEFEAFRLSWEALRHQPALRWSVAVWILFGLVIVFNHLWQPYFGGEAGHAGLGLIWILVVSAQFATGWLVQRHGVPEEKAAAGILFALFLSGAGLALISIVPGTGVALACLFLHEAGRGLFRPIVSAYTQKRVESRYRATFGSLQSLLGRTGCALALVLMWFLTEGKAASRTVILLVWTVAGVALMLGALVLWVFRPRSS